MSLHEIVLPETQPETEWVRGRALQKMSPTYSHASLQALIASALLGWLEREPRGRAGTEWRFRVTPPMGATRPLIPDVAYLSFDVLAADAPREEVEVPLAAPTVAFEILSSDDRRSDLDDKIRIYLASGSDAIMVVEPLRKEIEIHEAAGRTIVGPGEKLTHPALPGFVLDVRVLFGRAGL